MNRQHFGTGVVGVLSLLLLTAAIMAARMPENDAEQAGSLAPFAEVPRQANDQVDRHARTLRESLKGIDPAESGRRADLKAALDRYFAGSKIEQAMKLLEESATESPNSPEGKRAAAAIRVLKGEAVGPIENPAPLTKSKRFPSGLKPHTVNKAPSARQPALMPARDPAFISGTQRRPEATRQGGTDDSPDGPPVVRKVRNKVVR